MRQLRRWQVNKRHFRVHLCGHVLDPDCWLSELVNFWGLNQVSQGMEAIIMTTLPTLTTDAGDPKSRADKK